MSLLNRKLVRDLLKSKWQYVALMAMIVLGITFFNGAYAAYVNLISSYESSWEELRFEDFGITFNSAPERAAERVRSIRGVTAVEGRLVEDVALELPGRTTKKLIGRLISVPVERELTVNQLKLVQGHHLRSRTAREILLEASFAEHHELKPGDSLEVVRGTGRAKLMIAGIVQSDEYLYVVRSKHDLMAFPDTFGVMFVAQPVLQSLVGKPGSINEIRAKVSDLDQLDRIMLEAEQALAIYRPEEPVPREEQPSYQMLQQDVHGFQAYAVLFPVLFLSVATVTVYALLMRLVHQQRPVIGLLRSLGFSQGQVVAHYLATAVLTGFVSSILGSFSGVWMADWTSRFYMGELQVPFEQVVPRWDVVLFGIVIGTGTCAIGGIFPARYAAGIRPAEAMRPALPTFGRKSIMLDRILPRLKLMWRIPVRNVFRQPKRTVSTLFGIVAGVTLIITARGLLDSMSIAMEELVSGAFRYDFRLDYLRTRPYSDVNRVRSWKGVAHAEGLLQVPVQMRHGNVSYDAMVTGLPLGSSLHSLVDDEGNQMHPTSQGAIFGPTLKKRLKLEIGDLVRLTLPEELSKEDPSERFVRVAGFNEEAMGTVAYLPLSEVQKMFRKDLELVPNGIGAIVVEADPRYHPEIRRRLLSLPDAASITSMPDIRTMIDDLMQTMRTFVWIMAAFGAALAFAMVFNMVTINVLERSSEVATLRTIGASRLQIAASLALENFIVTIFGIVLGLPVGRWFVDLFWQAGQTPEQQELFTFNIHVSMETYVLTSAAILIVSVLSQIPALRLINKLDLAQAVKERST